MKTAIVTGVSSDIGAAVTSLLKANGWNIIGLSHEELDLSDLNAVAEKAVELNNRLSSIDALIHIAGLWHEKDAVLADRKLESFSSQQIADTLNVGLTAFMILTAQLLPKMNKNSTVLAISGTFSEVGAGWLPYFASKRGLEDFIVGLAQDYPDGPNIFGVSPADTATKAYKQFYPEYAAEAQSPKEVSELCLELVEDPDYHSGDIIVIRDGEAKKGYHA